MSYHFDTNLAKEDPSLNVCDSHLFQAAPDTTVMAMTVNPDVVLSAPDTLHIEGLYAFRLDLTGDAREDVVFKFRFHQPRHVNGDEHVHVQKFQVRRATGDAIGGDHPDRTDAPRERTDPAPPVHPLLLGLPPPFATPRGTINPKPYQLTLPVP